LRLLLKKLQTTLWSTLRNLPTPSCQCHKAKPHLNLPDMEQVASAPARHVPVRVHVFHVHAPVQAEELVKT
jgi:hypothetical protein